MGRGHACERVVCVCERERERGWCVCSQSQTWSLGSRDESPPQSQRTLCPDPHRSPAYDDQSPPEQQCSGLVHVLYVVMYVSKRVQLICFVKTYK